MENIYVVRAAAALAKKRALKFALVRLILAIDDFNHQDVRLLELEYHKACVEAAKAVKAARPSR